MGKQTGPFNTVFLKGAYDGVITVWMCKHTQYLPQSQWRHNGRDGVSNHQPHNCLRNRLFRRRSNQTSKLRVTGLYAGNSPRTGEFRSQKASNAENGSIWWRHHAFVRQHLLTT